MVIINEGGNDAQGYTLPFYHPDNSNWRQPLVNLRALPPHARWLAYSHFMSYLMLTVFYSDQLYGGQFYNKSGGPKKRSSAIVHQKWGSEPVWVMRTYRAVTGAKTQVKKSPRTRNRG